MIRNSVRRLLLLAALAAPGPLAAAEAVDVAEVLVKGQTVRADEAAWSTTTLDRAQIRKAQPGDLDELFRQTPGMAVRDLGLGGVANSIVIRGFGAGGHGGDLGAVLDGVPLNEAMSHADGYVDFNLLIPIEVEALTVYRGPVSALYGNYNRGGLVRIETRKGGDYLDADAAAGTFGTGDLQMALGRELGRVRLNLAGQAVTSEGFRPQSRASRLTASGRAALEITPRTTVGVSGRVHAAEADSAGYLTLAQFRADPRGIDPAVVGDGAEKRFASLRGDLIVRLTHEARLLGFGYVTQQDFTRWFTRPVGGAVRRQREESYERRVEGAGASLNGQAATGGRPWSYVAGVELFRERTDFEFHDGLVARARRGPAGSDRRIRLHSLSAFGELNASMSETLEASLGLRADRFTGSCRRRGPETGADPCGALEAVSQLSPKIGARWRAAEGVALRASWSTGFALPSGFVKYAVGGQNLDRNIFQQTEVGATFGAEAGASLDAAAYRLTSSDETRTVAPGVYENFGRTVREGVELAAEWRPSDQFSTRAVLGWTRTEVVENADPRLVGRPVPGVPGRTGTLDVTWKPRPRLSVEGSLRRVGGYAVDALNTTRAPAYETIDLTLAYVAGGARPYRMYARVENLTGATYAASMSVIGGETLVAPGAPRALRVGVQADF
jgi:outer membrane receptor protein involved in Fe transport